MLLSRVGIYGDNNNVNNNVSHNLHGHYIL